MNLVTSIENRLKENKTSVKSYVTYASACKLGENIGAIFAKKHGIENPVDFIPVYLPTLNRWTIVFRQMEWLQKHSKGGYLGWFATNGFFSI